ncbi:MAG TPA: HD domain-containing protein [Chloroflexota bacterium]|nr:HD domain-containing protein [Chloroflexota bacterium]
MQPTYQREDMPAPGRDDVIALLQRTGSDPALVQHVVTVCERALKLADAVAGSGAPVERRVVEYGALLHDMGIPQLKGEPVVVPEWGDRAKNLLSDNLMHPILGFDLAGEHGFPLSVRRCVLCHTPGPTREECLALGLTPPEEEMLPVSIEEKIVMYADFVTWAAMLGLNPWRDEREMALAGVPYFNVYWRAALGAELTLDGEVGRRWIEAQRELGRYARPEWFGIEA